MHSAVEVSIYIYTVVPKKLGRPPNTSTNAPLNKHSIYTKWWGAILVVDPFILDKAFLGYLGEDFHLKVASFFKPD